MAVLLWLATGALIGAGWIMFALGENNTALLLTLTACTLSPLAAGYTICGYLVPIFNSLRPPD